MKRTRSASVALGLLLVAGTGLGSSVLASCSGGDPKPKIAPSSPMSPSASDSPSPSQSLDQAFIAAFFQTIGQSTLSGDTSNFLAMTSPQCVNCRTLAGNIESAYEHGGHVEGGDWRVVEVERGGGGAPPDGEVWNVRVKTARERWFDGDGNLVKVVRPSVQKFGLLLSSGPDGALIRDLRLRS